MSGLFTWTSKNLLQSFEKHAVHENCDCIYLFFSIILEEIFKAGNIDRKLLPSDFYQLPPIEQVRQLAIDSVVKDTFIIRLKDDPKYCMYME